jgi:hypothetical protein
MFHLMNEALQVNKIPASDISDCADSYGDVTQLLAELCHRAPFYLSDCLSHIVIAGADLYHIHTLPGSLFQHPIIDEAQSASTPLDYENFSL